MRDGLDPDNPEKLVDNARRLVREFWKQVFEYRSYGSLANGCCTCLPEGCKSTAWCPRDIISGNFRRRAVDFQKLVEPLDVANWYYLQAKRPAEYLGEYTPDCKGRDKCYKGIDLCRQQAGEQDKVKDWHDKLERIAEFCRSQTGGNGAAVAAVAAPAHAPSGPIQVEVPEKQSMVDGKQGSLEDH